MLLLLLLFQNEMQNFTKLIVDMVKQEKLFASQGGPIILAQIENEYGNAQEAYGDAGKAYVQWCSNMAQSLNVGVPWIMCQQPDAPQPMVILISLYLSVLTYTTKKNHYFSTKFVIEKC